MLFPLQKLKFDQADEQQNSKILQTSALTSDSLGLLRQQLQSRLKDGCPPINQVAEATGISRRSLQRLLAKDHLTYSLLLAQVRFETAVSLLQNPTLKLIEISLELGYTDAANFTRAFKRWTGISPRQFRHLYVHVLAPHS